MDVQSLRVVLQGDRVLRMQHPRGLRPGLLAGLVHQRLGLRFADQRLQLELLPDTPKRTDSGWQGALTQAGYSVQAEGNGWTLSPAAGEPADLAADAPGAEDE